MNENLTENWLEKCRKLGVVPSAHTWGGWQNQFARTLRWYDRMQHISKHLKETGRLSQEDLDNVIAFFQNCYYLREWLVIDKTLQSSALNALFRSSISLQICRDICNGTKHFSINSPSVDKHFQIGREFIPESLRGNHPNMAEQWTVLAGGKIYDLFDLAEQCWLEWTQFLTSQGLISSS